jgi:hypothetical protein
LSIVFDVFDYATSSNFRLSALFDQGMVDRVADRPALSETGFEESDRVGVSAYQIVQLDLNSILN